MRCFSGPSFHVKENIATLNKNDHIVQILLYVVFHVSENLSINLAVFTSTPELWHKSLLKNYLPRDTQLRHCWPTYGLIDPHKMRSAFRVRCPTVCYSPYHAISFPHHLMSQPILKSYSTFKRKIERLRFYTCVCLLMSCFCFRFITS